MISAAAQFRKSGFNDKDAATLATVAAQYQNIADTAVSAEDAAASITSQIRAFGEDAAFATTVIDAYNEVANNFSIGTNDIASAMEVASSGLATYGNSFQQVIGLVTAGTEIMQGRSLQVARGLSTIASRIAKNQDALAEYGIAVQDTNGNLKSTYDVLAELKPKWDQMTDAQRVALGDTLAGTNQYKVLAAVLQNFEHATAATETALNSAGSAAQENAKYLESLEAREQSLKAELEDFANRVLSKEVVAGFYDATEAALQFINTDFGAATTRIIGTTTAITSLVGIIGTMGAKLVLVGKQLQSFGAANGVLGVLTAPKTLSIVAGGVTLVAALAEAIRAAVKAAEDAKFENRLAQLEEINGKITETKNTIIDLQEQLKKLNEIPDKDRSATWANETEELKRQLEAAKALLEIEEKRRKEQEALTYTSDRVIGAKTSIRSDFAVYDRYDMEGKGKGPVTGIAGYGFLNKEQIEALNKEYETTEDLLRGIGTAFADAFSADQFERLQTAIVDGNIDDELSIYEELLQKLGLQINEVSVSSDEYAKRQAVLASSMATAIAKTDDMTQAQKENTDAYISSNKGLYQYIKTLSSTSDEQSQFAAEYERLATAIVQYNLSKGLMDASDAVLYLTNTMGFTTEAAVGMVNGLEGVGSSAKKSADDFVKLTDGTIALKKNCEQVVPGVWKLKESLDDMGDAAEDTSNNLTPIQSKVQEVANKAIEAANAVDTNTAAFARLVVQEIAFNRNDLNTSQKISALNNYLTSIGVTQAGLKNLMEMERDLGTSSGDIIGRLENRTKKAKSWSDVIREAYNQINQLDFTTRVKPSSTGGGGGSSSTTSQKSPAQIAAEEATKAAKYRLDSLQDELDALNDEKSALEDEIQRIQDEVKAEYQAEIDILNDKKEAIQEAYEAWEEDADAVLDRLKAEKDAIQAVIDAIDKEKEQLEAATAYATEYASRQIDEIDTRLDELDAREAEINKKYDDELDKLKATNKELDKQIEREKLLQNLASAKNKKKRVYSAQQGYILVDDIAAISKAQAELDKFDRQQKQSLEEQEIENKRKQELLASGVEAERAALEEQKKLWEEYSKKWSSIVSDYEFKQNRLAYIQRYGKAIEQQNWQQRNRTVDQATREYADIMARLLAEQERMAAKEAEIAAQEAAMDEARIANQKATAAIEKQISDLQDEMVAAQEARTRKQVESLNALADAIEDAQRRVNQAQKDYDSAQEDEGAYDVDKPRVLKQVGGKAPDDAKVGDYIATADGIYHITGGYAGHWKSRRVSGTEGRSDLNNARAAANWLVKNGYLTAGEFGYRSGTTSATPGLHMLGENGPELGVLSRGDGVIPADITRNLMNIGKNPEKFANAAVARNGGDIIMQGVTLAFPNVRDGSDAAAFTKNFVNLAHQYAYKR